MADFVGGKTRSERAGADFVGGISICNLLFQNILVGAQADFVGGKTICNILFQNIKIRRVRGSAFCQKKSNPLLFWQREALRLQSVRLQMHSSWSTKVAHVNAQWTKALHM